ncbi:hypothetical protein, conserved [Eimeria brunetti]|uniref:Transmembrane protein n=1 Tax=Eimeria brunetti TaxID=51314 RepID=U6LPD1_9EIME|nr:hypothetical protein, conserved [Eimeria brunetti]
MPQQHNTFQGSPNPSAAPAAAVAELPTVESVFSRSGVVRGKACRSFPCLRVRLAVLASATAIALLVFFCSRTYERRAFQDLGSRKLASSEDGDAPVAGCGDSGDDEEEHHRSPHNSSRPDGIDAALPLKKRKVARVAEIIRGDGERYAQQQEQLQQHNAAAGPLFGSLPLQAVSTVEQHVPSWLPVSSQLFLGQTWSPVEPNASAGLTSLIPQRHTAEHFSSHSRQAASLEVRQLMRQNRKIQRQLRQLHKQQLQLRKMRRRLQRRHKHLQQYFLDDLYRQQPYLYWETLPGGQHEQRQLLIQQQELQQPSLVQQHWQQHLQEQQQQTLLQQQVVQQVVQDQEAQREMQRGLQQVTWQDVRQQRHQQGRRQQTKGELEQDQQRLVQPMEPLRGPPLDEDEWIAPDSPMPGAHEPGTSQQALQSPAPAGAADPSTFGRSSMQVIKGPHGASLTTSRAATGAAAGPSRDEGAAAPAAGLPPGSAAAERPSAFPFSDAPKIATESIGLKSPMLSNLLAHARAETRAGAGSEATPPAPSTVTAALPAMVVSALSFVIEHPFARLPRRTADCSTSPMVVDVRYAMTRPRGVRRVVPLLQQAYELLSQETLSPADMRVLVRITTALITYAMHYEQRDQSKRKTFRAIERLGIRFLLLDTLVSAFIVLGQKPEPEYWKLITDGISHSPPHSKFGDSFFERSNFLLSLCEELSNAIQMLKTGKRPNPGELVRIKRMLFCSTLSPAYFKGDDFAVWRKGGNCDVDGPSHFSP